MVGENARGFINEDHPYCLTGEIINLSGRPSLKSKPRNKWTVCMDGSFLLGRKRYVRL